MVGRKTGDCLEGSIDSYRLLWRFKPANPLETLLTKPSDIWQHLTTLNMLTVELNLKRTLELGTAEGESTVALLYAARQIGGTVHSIDINPCSDARQLIEKLGLQSHWDFTQADDMQVDWNEKIDHLFIDTSHRFDHTLAELKKYEPYVREGGIITLHDIVSFPPVMAAVNEHLKNRSDFRICKYLNNNGLAVIFKGKNAAISS
jgi:predicted O-methyltransferase YrrM